MDIYFLHHSGFMVDDHERCYIFDYYKDPAGHVEAMARAGRTLWFFVSHVHSDHFNPTISRFDSDKTVYFVHRDVPLRGITKGAIRIMDVDNEIIEQGHSVHMYGSTDTGGSFLVNTNAGIVFHAGDLNWWHWLGDTEPNNLEARQLFERELQRMEGITMDVAMFPVDARLEDAREWGLLEWLAHVKVTSLLIPMHMHDYIAGVWKPSAKFNEKYGHIPLWIPQKDGEERKM